MPLLKQTALSQSSPHPTCDRLHHQHCGVVVHVVLHLAEVGHHRNATRHLGGADDLPRAQLGGTAQRRLDARDEEADGKGGAALGAFELWCGWGW